MLIYSCGVNDLEATMKRNSTHRKDKYYISSKTNFWVGVSVLIIFIAYLILTVVSNSMGNSSKTLRIVIPVLRESVLVALSIVGTTWITSWIIDVRSKNEMYNSNMANDFIGDPDIYKCLSIEKRQEMLAALENQFVLNNNKKLSVIYNNVKKKFVELSSEKYYYEDCRYNVICRIYSDRIVKNITRTIHIYSYSEEEKISDLLLVQWAGLSLEGIDETFKVRRVMINGKEIPLESIVKRERQLENNISGPDAGYTQKLSYHYKEELLLSSIKPCIISISYTTITSCDDIVYTCRANVPCKNFSVNFRVVQSDTHKVVGRAFGFFDAAVNSPIIEDTDQVVVSFSDWIFPSDGVVISIAPVSPVDSAVVATPTLIPRGL